MGTVHSLAQAHRGRATPPPAAPRLDQGQAFRLGMLATRDDADVPSLEGEQRAAFARGWEWGLFLASQRLVEWPAPKIRWRRRPGPLARLLGAR